MLESVLNIRLLGTALFLVGMVLLIAYLSEKNKKARQVKKTGPLCYHVPGKTAAACRGLLNQKEPGDLFAYTLEATPQGGWYLTLSQHLATGQPLDTLYLLSFENDEPAVLSVRFIREAFGQNEAIVPPELLDAFFAQKLGAVRDTVAEERS